MLFLRNGLLKKVLIRRNSIIIFPFSSLKIGKIIIDRYAADRLLKLQGEDKKGILTNIYKRVAEGKSLTKQEKWEIYLEKVVLEHEDQLLAAFKSMTIMTAAFRRKQNIYQDNFAIET